MKGNALGITYKVLLTKEMASKIEEPIEMAQNPRFCQGGRQIRFTGTTVMSQV